MELKKGEDFSILAKIREDLSRGQPFPKIESNLVTLIILQFIEKDEAFNLLQDASNQSRAYCIR